MDKELWSPPKADTLLRNQIRKILSHFMKVSFSYLLKCRASWQKQVARQKGLTEADIREKPSKDPFIICTIDSKIFRDAVKTPCCETTYCEECIQTHLLEKDFICPKCGTKIASLDKLIIDKPTRARVMDYIDREIEASKREDESFELVSGSGQVCSDSI